MKLHELAFATYVYARIEDFDSSYGRFKQASLPSLDLSIHAHRLALLTWLNKWGCRQFKLEDHSFASEGIASWYHVTGETLPPRNLPLLSASGDHFRSVREAFDTLRRLPAGRFGKSAEPKTRTIGPAGAAKIMFALRPEFCVPWDDPIRSKRGYGDDGDSYDRFLSDCRRELLSIAKELRLQRRELEDLPQLLQRPKSSVAKLLDEFNWVTITRGIKAPAPELLSQWLKLSALATIN